MTRHQVHGTSNAAHQQPLESWNREASGTSYGSNSIVNFKGYGSIVDSDSSNDDRSGSPRPPLVGFHSDNKYHPPHAPQGILKGCRRPPKASGKVFPWCLVMATAVGLACLWRFALVGAGMTPDEKHQETVVPTLLQVVHASNNTLVYAPTNPLYDRLINAARASKDHRFPSLFQGSLELQPLVLLDRAKIRSGDPLRVIWQDADGRSAGFLGDDVLALFCGEIDQEDDRFLEAATLDQIRATNRFHGDSDELNGWYLPSFPVLRQDQCFFRLYFSDQHVWALQQKPLGPVHPSVLSSSSSSSSLSSLWQLRSGGPSGVPRADTATPITLSEYWYAATSDYVHIVHAQEEPTALHLAFGDEPSTEMTVQFATGEVPSTEPIVEVASRDGSLWVVVGSTDTYQADHLCQAPGNQPQAGRFYPPGALHTVRLTELDPHTEYFYRVGLRSDDHGSVLVWSEKSSFWTASLPGDRSEPFSYLVYGDQGCPHSGWRVGQEWMESMIQRETSATSSVPSTGRMVSVHHFGDISYSRGSAHVWDAWFDMIRPMASKVPLMIAIGNHEYDHTAGGQDGRDPSGVTTPHGYMPSWGNFAEDSGGECGVTMAKRFRMPSSITDPTITSPSDSNGVFWYSFDYAIVHTVVLSSEHDMSKGSLQYQFLEANLAEVDRKVTPWVVLELHRPLYEGEGSGNWWNSNIVGKAMRNEIEDLLLDYKVDLVLSGHYHEYQRSCDGLYKGRCGKGGPMHITVGSAGAKLDNGFELVNTWTQHYIKGEYGYGRITVANHTDLHFEFVRHGKESDPTVAGTVEDEVWIHRDRD